MTISVVVEPPISVVVEPPSAGSPWRKIALGMAAAAVLMLLLRR
jgi:MYXO-CTERM domain-containing protein